MDTRFGRRALLGWGLALPWALTRRAAAEGGDPAYPDLVLGPYLCDPRPEAIGFFVQATPGRSLTVRVEDEGGTLRGTAGFALDAYGIARADVHRLRPETPYRYAILDGDRRLAEARFSTPPRSPNRRIRLAFGADIHRASKPYVLFDRVREARPAALFCIGDQVYADAFAPPIPATEAAYRALYPDNWDDRSLAACWAEIPTLLAWDDHEIWNDFDHTVEPERFAPAAAAADAYQHLRNPFGLRPGVRWYQGRLGPCAYFVLDLRTHRDPNQRPENGKKTILGARQRRALVRFLREVRAPLKVVVSPSSFHDATTTGADAFAVGFRAERDHLFDVLKSPSVGRVILVSGDMHWPAVVAHTLAPGRVIHEFQCTPIAAFSRPPPSPTPASMPFVGTGAPGFGRLDVDARGHETEVDFAWIEADGVPRFRMRVPFD